MITVTQYPSVAVFSKNAIPVRVETDNYIDPLTSEPRPNFRICLRVEMESVLNSGNFDRVIELEAIPQPIQGAAEHFAWFDLNQLLSDWLREIVEVYAPGYPLFPIPFATVNTRVRFFRAFAYEKYGIPATPQAETALPAKEAHLGGTSDRCRNEGYYHRTPFQNDPLYTQWRKVIIKQGQPHYLTVYYPENSPTTTLLIRITYTDGSTVVIPFPSPIPPMQAGSTLTFTSDYDTLGLGAIDPSKLVSHWNFQLTDASGTILIPYRRIRMCYEPCKKHCTETIMWRNGMGGFDSFSCTSYANEEMTTKGVYATRPRGYAQNVYDNRTITHRIKAEQTFTIRTMLHGRETQENLADLLTSEEILWVKEGEAIPVVIRQSKAVINDCFTGLFALEIEVSPSQSYGAGRDVKTLKIG